MGIWQVRESASRSSYRYHHYLPRSTTTPRRWARKTRQSVRVEVGCRVPPQFVFLLNDSVLQMDRKLLNSEGSEFSITSRTQLLCETSSRGTVVHTSICVPAVRSLPLSYSPDSTAIRIVLGQYYHVVK